VCNPRCPPPPYHTPCLWLINPVGAPRPVPGARVSLGPCVGPKRPCVACLSARVRPCLLARVSVLASVCGPTTGPCSPCVGCRAVGGVSPTCTHLSVCRVSLVCLSPVCRADPCVARVSGVGPWAGFRPPVPIYPCVGCLSCLIVSCVSVRSMCAPSVCRATISRVSTAPIAVSVPCDITTKHYYPIPYFLFHAFM
jgi:hypothetical protein